MPGDQPPAPRPDPAARRKADANKLADNRRLMDAQALARPLPAGIRYDAARVGGVTCEWAIPPTTTAADACLLYAHGGAFCVGSVITHRGLVGTLAAACGLPALSVGYRLAPEHGFPAAPDDLIAVYRALLPRYRRIMVVGDSAGGALAAGLPLRARAEGLPLPAAVVLLSPWLDLACTAASFQRNAASDPFMDHPGALFVVRGYLKQADPTTPLVSPLYGDLSGYPPVLLQASGSEALLDDSTRFAARAEAAGVSAQLSVWPGVHHVWHSQYDTLPAARDAIAEIGRFVHGVLQHAGPQAGCT